MGSTHPVIPLEQGSEDHVSLVELSNRRPEAGVSGGCLLRRDQGKPFEKPAYLGDEARED